MNRKARLLIVAASLVMPMLAGCGGNDGEPIFLPGPPPQNPQPDTRANVLTLPNVILTPGTLTPVEVRLTNPSGVAGVQGRILYDASVIEVVNPDTLPEEPNAFEGSVLPAGATINYEENRPPVNGQKGITFAIGNPTGTNTTGRLFRLWVRPRAGLPANSATALQLDPSFPFLMAGAQGKLIPSTVSEGSLIVGQ